MTVNSISLELPEDAILSIDSSTGAPVLTIRREAAIFLAQFLLKGVPSEARREIPLTEKEEIAKGASGLKYVFRLPAIGRALAIGVAAGLVLTLAAQDPVIGEIRAKGHLVLVEALEYVGKKPGFVASAITVTALATTQVSDKAALIVSDILEGSWFLTRKTASIAWLGTTSILSLMDKVDKVRSFLHLNR